ncbi:MAG TPA: pyridoxal phosphate-dependent aminotransferase [Bryobacteraceae bacterium]|nr:pyridoxal phosphate-dependent aminotransferase [Bryobacteraceae bacterium]
MPKSSVKNSLTRRSLGRFAGVLAAGSAIPVFTEPMLAQIASKALPAQSGVISMPADAVKINANEYPAGPCAEAAEAVHTVIRNTGRYLYEHTFELTVAMARSEDLVPDYVQPFAGSSDALHRFVLACTGPSRSLVVADPGYEAGARAAQLSGARVVPVKLAADYAHDVKAMAAADRRAGLIYVCNPNNPTGTLTPRADIEWLLNNKPEGSVLLVDEAYIHFSPADSCADLVARDKDIVVLRTFSKLYGMAGLRAGVAMARPDLLARIKPWAAGSLPATSMVGATVSLQVKNLVATRRKSMRDIRDDTFSFLTKHNIGFIPSESNCFMLDAKRPGAEFVAAMAKENIYVGRVWSALPNHSRITVGSAEDMARFHQALLKVMAQV